MFLSGKYVVRILGNDNLNIYKSSFLLKIGIFWVFCYDKMLTNPAVVAWFVQVPVFYSVYSEPDRTVDRIPPEACLYGTIMDPLYI